MSDKIDMITAIGKMLVTALNPRSNKGLAEFIELELSKTELFMITDTESAAALIAAAAVERYPLEDVQALILLNVSTENIRLIIESRIPAAVVCAYMQSRREPLNNGVSSEDER